MKTPMKWAGLVFGILGGIILLVNLMLFKLGESRLKHIYTIQKETISIPFDEKSLAEGKRIFQYRGCEACHGEQLQGQIYLDNPAIGQVITPMSNPCTLSLVSVNADRKIIGISAVAGSAFNWRQTS